MQAQQTWVLNEEQREVTIKNWFELLNMETVEKIIDEPHPRFSKDDIKKYNLKLVTKFANHYWVYKCIQKETHIPHFFIFVEATKFDLIFFRACSWYYHIFEDELQPVNGYDFNATCQVFLCPTFTIAAGMRTHVATDIFPTLYRFVPLADVYISLGSKAPDSKFGLAYDYSLTRHDPNAEKKPKEYATILSSDVIARIMNANPGDVITHTRLLWESGTAYSEKYHRVVQRVASSLNVVQPDGKCFGHMGAYEGIKTRRLSEVIPEEQEETKEQPEEQEESSSDDAENDDVTGDVTDDDASDEDDDKETEEYVDEYDDEDDNDENDGDYMDDDDDDD